jgi:Ca2+:H+ antiporter
MAYALLLFVPLSLSLRYLVDAPPTWVFLTSAVAIAVLADWIRRATEQLAERAGSTIGSLLNVSFGNIAELVLASWAIGQPMNLVFGSRSISSRSPARPSSSG